MVPAIPNKWHRLLRRTLQGSVYCGANTNLTPSLFIYIGNVTTPLFCYALLAMMGEGESEFKKF